MQLFLEVPHTKFEPNLGNSLWDIHQSTFIDLHKLGIVMDQYC